MTSTPRGRALITGAGGQVGRELQAGRPDSWTMVACGSRELDVTDRDQVRLVVERERPTVVIHAAAYTAVDAAESDVERAEAVNARGTAQVAEAVERVGARLVYVSTDFVFDGSVGTPYGTDAEPRPLGVYGRTKLAGERTALRTLGERGLVVRTAWVYSRYGQNFVRTMLGLMRERDEVCVVGDQIGTPTWGRPLATVLWAAAARPELHGILHWTDAGVASWYDFAVAIQEEGLKLGLLERAVPVRPVTSDEYRSVARRPAFSVLDKRASWATLGVPVLHWRESLRRMLRELADSRA
jgi:dTDP-4-dehydrorhamnose reductase